MTKDLEKKIVCTNTNGTQYDFNQCRDLNQFGNEIYSDEIPLDEARGEQLSMSVLINKLKDYDARNPKKKKSKQKVLDNVQKLYNVRNDIINVFENKMLFRQSDIDNITNDFSGQIYDMYKLKDEESEKEKKI